MMDTKTLLLIAGIIVLIVIFTRKAILKQKREMQNPVIPAAVQRTKAEKEKSVRKLELHWRSTAYLLGLAAIGNLYSGYLYGRKALETMSTAYWLDTGLSLAAAVVALFLWRKKAQDLALLFAGIILIQVMFSIATSQIIVAITHAFPLALVYLVVKPVWEDMQ